MGISSKLLVSAAILWPFLQVSSASGADLAAGKALAEQCSVCHGANGVSVSDDIPNLAGQKIKYLETQLQAFRSGTRKNSIMNAMAEQLSDDDIVNLAAFWNGVPAQGNEKSSSLDADANKTNVTFPENYKTDFTQYLTINKPAKKQVRRYHANETAIKAIRAGKEMGPGAFLFVEVFKAKLDDAGNPVTGSDGFFEPGDANPAFYTAMQAGAGWGDHIPEIYRNDEWNQAVFNSDKSLKAGVNQAKCLACHKPLKKDSYAFTFKQLEAAFKN